MFATPHTGNVQCYLKFPAVNKKTLPGLVNINSDYIWFWIVCFIKNSALCITLWRVWAKICRRWNKYILTCWTVRNFKRFWKSGKQVIEPKKVSTFAGGNWSLGVFFTHRDKLMICGMKRRHSKHPCKVMSFMASCIHLHWCHPRL